MANPLLVVAYIIGSLGFQFISFSMLYPFDLLDQRPVIGFLIQAISSISGLILLVYFLLTGAKNKKYWSGFIFYLMSQYSQVLWTLICNQTNKDHFFWAYLISGIPGILIALLIIIKGLFKNWRKKRNQAQRLLS